MVKQVIIIRKDLRNVKGEKIRTGKYIAQASHAVLGSILQKIMNKPFHDLDGLDSSFEINSFIEKGSPIHFYLTGLFKKTSLSVNSEKELLDLHDSISKAGFISVLIQDAGLTEFGGVPTYTCLAVEPLFEEVIDKFTGHLGIF